LKEERVTSREAASEPVRALRSLIGGFELTRRGREGKGEMRRIRSFSSELQFVMTSLFPLSLQVDFTSLIGLIHSPL